MNVKRRIYIIILSVQKYIPLAYQKQASGMEERFSQNFNKLYYSIGEVADMFGVNASLIRFWEKEFEVIKPKKNAKGNRKFTPKDIEVLKTIFDLVKVKGFTLEGAKKAMNKREVQNTIVETKTVQEIGFDVLDLKRRLMTVRDCLTAMKM
jgi:DNA-binding transcriptional MerR regulator